MRKDHAGTADIQAADLLLLRRKRRWGFEFKLSEAPKLTKSMRVATQDLKLQQLWVVHAGEERIHLAENVTAIPLSEVPHLEGSDRR